MAGPPCWHHATSPFLERPNASLSVSPATLRAAGCGCGWQRIHELRARGRQGPGGGRFARRVRIHHAWTSGRRVALVRRRERRQVARALADYASHPLCRQEPWQVRDRSQGNSGSGRMPEQPRLEHVRASNGRARNSSGPASRAAKASSTGDSTTRSSRQPNATGSPSTVCSATGRRGPSLTRPRASTTTVASSPPSSVAIATTSGTGKSGTSPTSSSGRARGTCMPIS